MASNAPNKEDTSAQQAYAAAAAVIVPPAAVEAGVANKVEATPATPVPVTAAPAPVAVKAAKVKAVRTKASPKVNAKQAPAKAIGEAAIAAKSVKTAKFAKAPKAAKLAAPSVSKTITTPNNPTVIKLKDTIMATKSKDFVGGLKDVVANVQDKAKAAYAKGTAAVSDAGEFAKGNAEAMVESSKILASGLQEMGTTYVSESKSAFETMTADVKAFAAVKSPTDFFKLQSEFLRRNFDSAMATGSKNSEAAIKLANDAFAPISGRVNLAMEKAKQAA